MSDPKGYEVEQKFRVSRLEPVIERLRAMDAELKEAVEQVDTYFAHPSRDFASTDEAFRLRRVDQSNRVTYKGPKVDSTTKTREEIELPLPDGQRYATRFAELLKALGFSPVAEVKKQRRTASFDWRGEQVEVALDEVARLGSFVEVELQAEEATLSQARQLVAALSQELQLTENERRSYLEMLLEQQSG